MTALAVSENGIGQFPLFLPDGRHFLFIGRPPSKESFGVLIGSIEPGFEPRVIIDANAVISRSLLPIVCSSREAIV